MTAPVRLRVRLTPRGGRDAIEGWDGVTLRARVAAAPVDGKANDALARMIAAALGVPRSSVRIASGAASRLKVVEIADADEAGVREKLAAAAHHAR